jgi:inner membrane protein
MDPLTHTLVGAALGETGLARASRYAGAALLIGANLPDVDVLSYLGGPDAGFALRRGVTHGVPALALWPLVLAAALWAWDRLPVGSGRAGDLPLRFGRLVAVGGVGVISHPLLDWLNTYGIRLLSPFDERWFYGDSVFIVDPWLWLTLGSTVMLARVDRHPRPWLWVALALAASFLVLGNAWVPRTAKTIWVAALAAVVALRVLRRPRCSPRRVARVGLALAALQIALHVGISAAGRVWVQDELDRRDVRGVEDLMVGPVPADPLRWDVVVRVQGTYRRGTLDWAPGPRLWLGEHGAPVDPDPARSAAARGAPCIAGTLNWMRFPFSEVTPSDDGFTVRFIDARYGRERSAGFGTVAVGLDRDLVPRCGESPRP